MILNVNANATSNPVLYEKKLRSKAVRTLITPDQALIKLKEGNLRLLSLMQRKSHYIKIAKYTSQQGQFPFAIILSCIDSRSVPEIIFDQSLGDIFSARVAGNVINADMLGSMEFATKVAGAKLIVVMGHTQCGAVKAACQNVKLGHITNLVKQITPAVNTVKAKIKKLNCDNSQNVDLIAKQNVLDQLQLILSQSTIIKNLVETHQVKLIGAMHNLKTGKVTFFNAAKGG